MFDYAPLFSALIEDFTKFQKGSKAELSDYDKHTIKEFAEGLDAPNQDAKYIRIVCGNGTPNCRVWGFVVNTHDDPKFKYGDILKAAGWKAPAKNFARGSIFKPEDFKNFRWTSAG